MRSTRVYDLPTRLFHWLFSGLFLFSFGVGKTIDDDSWLFSYHMISGLILGGLVVWRISWGFMGSRYARFSQFQLNPLELKNYFLGLMSGTQKRWTGHNPASSWATLVMLILGLSLAVTGFFMSTGQKEALEDVHEILANTFILVVILHVAGVVLHSLRHRDNIGLSMVDGKKQVSESGVEIPSSHPMAAVFLLVLMSSWALYLTQNYNAQTRTLGLFGTTLELGEGPEKGEIENDQDVE